jgi:1-deoxy-D-xylulose-5-phosphate reductoisomerase
MAAVKAGKRLLLANKEALVVGGEVFMQAVRQGGAQLLPIDSEHSAIFQSLPEDPSTWANRVEKIILTASGGPFRERDPDTLQHVTPDQACAHPNWVMGRKISVDSATLMNKGLEVIEARRLFGLAPEQVEVVVHRQSLVHSLVEYVDGSMLAQLGSPDMRTPIAHALGWPERLESGVQSLDLAAAGTLQFEPPDTDRFPCLALAQQAGRAGGLAPTVLNAANEVAVAAFLEGRLNFCGIPAVIERVLAAASTGSATDLGSILAADADARARAALEVRAR